MSTTEVTNTQKRTSPDLLNIPLLRRILLSRYMPLAIQVPVLLLFGWAVYDGFFGAQVSSENFATLGVWSIFFWPVILLSLVFLNRAWCGVCPMGSITAIAGRWSLGLSFPKTLRNKGLSLGFFILVLWMLRSTLELSGSPGFTAWFLVVWAIAALVVGFVYTPRSFCRFVCPIAAPLSLLGRVAPVVLQASGGQLTTICSGCQGKECYNGSNTVEGCPAGEYPAAMESNSECLWCLKCLKNCTQKGQLHLKVRWPFSELVHVKRPSLLDGLTVMSLMGIFLFHMALGMESRTLPVFKVWGQWLYRSFPGMEYADVFYLLTITLALAAMGGLLTAAAFATSRLARLSYRKSLAISSYAFVALVAFRAFGYMIGAIITGAGDWINYIGSLLGIHVYYPSSLVSWAFKPLLPGTGYHLQGILLTIPLALGLVLAWFLAYRIWRNQQFSLQRALLIALPNMVAMAIIVAIYELAYLIGYRVV